MPIRIDTNSLANLLRFVPKATMIGLFTRTVPVMRKRDNPFFGRVVKLARLTAVIGGSYASAVNRRRLKEGAELGLAEVNHFTAEPRGWGQRVRLGQRATGRPVRSPLVEYQGKFYLDLQRQRMLQVEYRDSETEKPIATDDLLPWPRLGNESERQRLRRPVIVRDYSLDSILQLRMRGRIFVIENRPARRRA